MRQHIVRLLIVLALVVGIGALIFSAINDNTPLNIVNFASEEAKSDAKVETEFDELNSKVDASFNEKVTSYNILDDNLNFYIELLTNASFTKGEAGQIKNLFKTYRNEMNSLNTSMISLKNYLEDSEHNETELLGRKAKVNDDFVIVLNSKLDILKNLESLILSKIFDGNSYDSKFVLAMTNNILMDCYIENNTKFEVLTAVNTKTKAFINSKQVASDNIVKYTIKFNQMTRSVVIADFGEYFKTNTVSSNLQILLNYLNSEAYYEEN
ncbi:MAG: hypothetical protein E7359_00650 [Clostridiales bacterium]|nr:hypothetical protein [Clostridiales bacterium]